MKNYQISFIGRTKGALGITYRIVDTVQAEDEKKAILALYDKYEHIALPVITEVSK